MKDTIFRAREYTDVNPLYMALQLGWRKCKMFELAPMTLDMLCLMVIETPMIFFRFFKGHPTVALLGFIPPYPCVSRIFESLSYRIVLGLKILEKNRRLREK